MHPSATPRSSVLAAALLGVLLLCLRPASAGWRVVQAEDGGGQTTMLLEGGALRVEQAGMVTILDVDRDTLIVLELGARRYAQVKLSEFIGQMRAMVNAARELLAQLPPELRAGVQDPAKALDVQLKASGQEETVGAWKAKRFTLLDAQGKESGTVWLSRDGQMGQLSNDLLRVAKAIDLGVTPALGLLLKTAQQHGFPVKTSLKQGAQTRTSTVVELASQRVEPGAFQVPPGFTRGEPDRLLGLPAGRGP